MEISQGQNMQECSSQSGSCNFINHGSSVKAERGAFAETHGAVVPAALQVTNHALGCDEVPVAVKLELDVKDAIITEDVEEKYTGSWEDSMADSSLFIKKEHDFVVKKEHETAGVTVKHKLEIEPTVLQSHTAAPLHVSTPIAQTSLRSPFGLLSRRVLVLPPLPPAPGTALRPRRSALVSDHRAAARRTRSPFGRPRSPSPSLTCPISSLSRKAGDIPREGNISQTVVKEHFYNSSGSEDASEGTEEKHRCGYCIRSPTQCDRSTDVTRAEAVAHLGGKQYKCDYCK
ncbi:hypothetical protein EVAR_57727_1 [Eumeta japonica]|uniref:Uncharacterized protein n=1 Tax=Eumeta variegata TaxID=151549 RepID=A0A4C1Y7N0_EUMVA|nr:hypothetical protein EVAR_57727_1 [Eumeta japonica]